MSFLSNVLRSGGASFLGLGRRSRGYEYSDNYLKGLSLANSKRAHSPARSSRHRTRVILFWALIPIILITSALYVSSRVNLSHLKTAAQCQWTVSRMQHPARNYHFTNITNDDMDESAWATVITPTEVMERLESGTLSSRIIHQSWKSDKLPQRFAKWSQQWRQLHGSDWTYVLWTDADNLKLVERFYPQFLNTYNTLPREIYRADMARNMYMHAFGGIYADLDLVPLSPLPQHLPIFSSSIPPSIHVAYVGHMSSDDFEHSIPNAFMASVPAGHPFWLKPLHFVQDNLDDESHSYPEALTGPMALRTCVKKWEKEKEERLAKGVFDELTVLENGKIYPFSWWDSPFADQCICRPQSAFFDPHACNSLYPDAITITYWSHSWEDYSW